MLAFITSLRHPQNSSDYTRVERLLKGTLASVTAQTDPGFVVIVVGNERPAFDLPRRTVFVQAEFPPPAPPDGPRSPRDDFVRDKGSKIGLGLVAAREYSPDYVMIFDADDFVSRDLAGWVNARHAAPGWVIDRGWMYSAARGAMRPVDRFHRTCGTSFVLPWEVYEVPECLSTDSTQAEVMAAYGEILPNVLGAHRNLQQWLAERGRVVESLPFRGAVYHVDTGENHSGKTLTGLARPLSGGRAAEFGMPPVGTVPAVWRSLGPVALKESWDARGRERLRRSLRIARG